MILMALGKDIAATVCSLVYYTLTMILMAPRQGHCSYSMQSGITVTMILMVLGKDIAATVCRLVSLLQ